MNPEKINKHNPTFRRIAAALLIISIGLVGAAVVCMEVQSSLRAYVGGESLWSKGQKQAVYYLRRLAQSRTAADYAEFRAAIDVPLGDHEARLELEKPDYDDTVARAGFIRGRNHPDDISGMIYLYRIGRHVVYMEKAIDVWTRADPMIEELAAIGERVNAEVRKPQPDEQNVAALMARAYELNDALTPLESEFSVTLGEGSRAISTLLLQLMVALSVVLVGTGLLTVRALLMRNERLQAELRAREEHYRSLFENSMDAVLLISPDGTIHEANQAACRLFGYTPEELREVGRYGVMRPDTPGLAEALRERDRTGSFKTELQMLRKDGSLFMADVSSAIFHNSAGNKRTYLIIRDITPRKDAERRLERLSRFNTVFRRVSQAIARTREPAELYSYLCACAVRDGGLRMACVLRLDPATGSLRAAASEGGAGGNFDRALISATPDSPFGRGPAAQVVRTGISFVNNDFAAAEIGAPWREDLLHAGFKAVAVYPLREQGAVIGIFALYAGETGFFDQPLIDLMDQLAREVSFALDHIGDQKARAVAEESLRSLNRELEQRVAERTADLRASNEALQTSSQELATFSYSVSHDLRGPLRAINGFASLLLSDHAGELDAQGHEYLERLRDASLRMDRLTNGLLDLAQLGRGAFAPTDLDLSALARGVASELQATEPDRAIEWVIEAGVQGRGDPALVQVMLQQLIGNAWKFTREVPQARIEFGGRRDREDQVTCFVADNGCGLDMAYAEKIFNAFARLHPMNEYEGIGIGLATVKRILERHGGRIWVEAAPRIGATFYFTLPPV
ncbi:MAG TPA: PAS domain S-box protein [Burkholderiales bacterium]